MTDRNTLPISNTTDAVSNVKIHSPPHSYPTLQPEQLTCAELIASRTDEQRYNYYVELVVIGVLFFTALIGNICVLLALWQRRAKKSRMHLFIAHLAFADLIVAVFAGLPEFFERYVCGFYAADALCKVVKYMQIVGIYGSTYVLLCMAYDRYSAIRYPMRSFKFSRKWVHISVVCAWSLAFLFSIPQLPLWENKKVNSGVACKFSVISESFTKVYVFLYLVMIVIIPAFALTYLYSMIATIIMRNIRAKRKANSSRERDSRQNTSNKNHLAPRASGIGRIPEAKVKTVKMTLVIVIFYVVCTAPFYTTQVLVAFGFVQGNLTQKFVLLLYVNSCVNPWIYMFFSGNLLRDLKEFCCCVQKESKSFVSKKSGEKLGRTNLRHINTTNESEYTMSTTAEFQLTSQPQRTPNANQFAGQGSFHDHNYPNNV
ncbi:mesotocin receptor-like [Clavelina lepadiformis]|uniref:mesotocin receptor-like n=1 Tax=Clavelina lepadiformis TaxID=159417 RepID=UPI004043706D